MTLEQFNKKDKIFDLLLEVGDDLLGRYFDRDSDELLDEKLEVLMVDGKAIKDIRNYYDVLSLPVNAH